MPLSAEEARFLDSVHPYTSLPEAMLADLAGRCSTQVFGKGETVFSTGDALIDLYIIQQGEVQVFDEAGVEISRLGPRNSFGERALLRGVRSVVKAAVTDDAKLILLPSDALFELIEKSAVVAQFFDRRRRFRVEQAEPMGLHVADLMTSVPVTCAPETPISAAAQAIDAAGISSICVVSEQRFEGIVTVNDMVSRVVVGGQDPAEPISSIMPAETLSLGPDALGTDVLHMMVERGIKHVPIVEDGALVGIVTQTDLSRAQAVSSADLVLRVRKARDVQSMALAVEEIPQFLAQLVGAGKRHEIVTRLISDIADAVTRRLLALAQEALGAPPVPYLWLACGSQGRQEQTGVSDQDNCLILSDAVTDPDMAYFEALARFVCDGLDACGYVYCPGDMMATNPRWCQPLNVWRTYFEDWITTPDTEAQMLASVMFDLRPIGGDETLFEDLKEETLRLASERSIFVAHMTANSLKHHPPIGLLRGLATIRSGEHRDRIDLKHTGVVPIVDLGRLYALQGQLMPANTHERLEAARKSDILSQNGGADLLDAYDLIATTRLEHQARQIRSGKSPDNYLDPAMLSDLERSHLRDAFVVVRTMQSAVGSGKAMLG